MCNMVMQMAKRIYVAHGAKSNSGDFLIFNRGWNLLERVLGTQNIELVPVKRWEPITGYCDILIILGGPIITRKMHPQSVHIKEYLEKNKVPVICLGIGISGKDYIDYEPYFTDEESVDFWTSVYNSTKLFSVRDIDTLNVLNYYNIPATLTGCPALFDCNFISHENELSNNMFSNDVTNLTVTIPNNKKMFFTLSAIRTLFFLYYLNTKLSSLDSFIQKQVVFQHGYQSSGNMPIAQFARLMGFSVIDGSGRGINDVSEISDSSVHIGTRLHMNLFFLSQCKVSYLLSVDNRTDAFLKTIPTPSENFSIRGIKCLVDEYFNDLTSDGFKLKFSFVRPKIIELYDFMLDYLKKIKQFVNS